MSCGRGYWNFLALKCREKGKEGNMSSSVAAFELRRSCAILTFYVQDTGKDQNICTIVSVFF